ncbi:HEAT repeat domain-containing protein [Gemmata algarum]|uniref:HEAT repeat domain-containing protein n=1 Tax=Gemmata algarum TaxID=2975278 RepID=UPI0039C8EB6E
MLDDHDSEVRIPAVEALGRIGPAAQPAGRKLKELLRDPLVWPVAQKALEKIEAK